MKPGRRRWSGYWTSWTSGLLVFWSSGLLVFWSSGLLVFWSSGLLDFWAAGPVAFRTSPPRFTATGFLQHFESPRDARKLLARSRTFRASENRPTAAARTI